MHDGIDTSLTTIVDTLYAQNIIPIRIKPNDKAPIDADWQTGTVIPDKDTLIKELQDGTVGLGVLCGAQSGIIAVDIDTDNEQLFQVVEATLGKSPCIKVGNRGRTYFYLYNNEHYEKIKASLGTVDILSNNPTTLYGRNCVIPPSIHPSKKPYRDWETDRKSTRLNSSHSAKSRMPSSA